MFTSPFFERKLKPKVSLDITPLVDIVFLLVAFFMVFSSFEREQIIQVDLPKAKKSRDAKQQKTVVTVTAEGKVKVAGKEFARTEYRQAFKAWLTKQGKDNLGNVVLRGDKNSSYEVIVGVMDILSSHGIADFSLAVDRDSE